MYSNTESSRSYSAVTPSDTTNFAYPCRALYVGGTGNVVAVTAVPSSTGGYTAGTAVTFTNVQAGTYLPIWALRVNSTSTTATGIVALF